MMVSFSYSVSAYAILRFAKHKGGAPKALSAHHERTKDVYASNPEIDPSRTEQNFHLVTPRRSYEQEINRRFQMAGCRVWKDSMKFVDTLVTVSPEFVQTHEAEMKEYFTRAFEFLKEHIGEDNIISAVVHMDEKTPHLHLCFVPLTRDGRLSAKEIKRTDTKSQQKIAGIRFMTLIFWPSIFRLMAKIRREPTQVISVMMLSPRKGTSTDAASVIRTR